MSCSRPLQIATAWIISGLQQAKRAMLIATVLFHTISTAIAQIPKPGDQLPLWEKGMLDIHHINTGRGNAAFMRMPDGTTLLIDAGELSPLDARTFTQRNAPIRPDSSRKAYEWICDYIKMAAPDIGTIDYALITHFHDDHFGAWYPGAPSSSSGYFRRTGITGVGDLMPIGMLVDRGNPDYQYPYDLRKQAGLYAGGELAFDSTMDNYLRFVSEYRARGMLLQPLRVGVNSQLVPVHDPSFTSSFFIRNVKASGQCWTGRDSAIISLFPDYKPADRSTWPDENSLSLALLIGYGPFRYYTGGDNPGMLFTGTPAWRDVETPIANAIGPVDVAVMDHHGNRDAINENQIRLLKPRVWIGQTWSSDHPGHEVLVRLTNQHIYSGPRDLFATNMLEANRLVIGPLIDRAYKSQQGHILLRVMPGGNEYYIIVLNDTDRSRKVKAVFGPYQSSTKSLSLK